MKKIIVTVTKTQVIIETINPKAKDPILTKEVFEWKKGNLGKVITENIAPEDQETSIRLLLAEDFYYLVGFEVDTKLENNRVEIKNLAGEMVLENLDKVRWDYAVISSHDKKAFIQCFVLTKDFNKELEGSFNDIPVMISAIEPYSLALMESFENNRPSFLLIHHDQVVSNCLLVKDGLVVFSKSISLEDFDECVNNMIIFSRKFYKLKIEKLLLSGIKKSAAEKYQKTLKIIEVDIQANINLAEKTLLKGKDSKVLNIQEKPGKHNIIDESDDSLLETLAETKIDKLDNFYFYAVLFIFSILGLGVGFFVISSLKGVIN